MIPSSLPLFLEYIYIYICVCLCFVLFIYLFYFFFSTEPFGLCVTGACWGPAWGARGLVAGWAGQSGVLAPQGCDCSCSPQAS